MMNFSPAQGGEKCSTWRQQKLSGMMGLGASQIPEAARQSEGSDLRKARSVLALTAAPKSLPCREAERESIAAFVQEAVQAGWSLPSPLPIFRGPDESPLHQVTAFSLDPALPGVFAQLLVPPTCPASHLLKPGLF